MKKQLFYVAAIALLFTACNKGSKAYQSAKPKTEIDSVSYAIGVQIASDLQRGGIDKSINPELVARAIYDVMNEKSKLFGGDTVAAVLIKYFDPQSFSKLEENKKKEATFFSENGKKANVRTTASGLQYEVISEGTGAKPKETNTVKVHYKGELLDGTVFDSSIDRKEPAIFPLANLIQGWKEGILLMPVGSKFKFYVPSNLAYGSQGIPQAGIGPNEPLVFEVELISIEPDAPAPMQLDPSALK